MRVLCPVLLIALLPVCCALPYAPQEGAFVDIIAPKYPQKRRLKPP